MVGQAGMAPDYSAIHMQGATNPEKAFVMNNNPCSGLAYPPNHSYNNSSSYILNHNAAGHQKNT